MNSKKHSTLTRQLTVHLFRSTMAASVFILLCSSSIIIYNHIRHQTAQIKSLSQSMLSQYAETIRSVELSWNTMAHLISDSDSIASYMQNPTPESKAFATLTLHDINNSFASRSLLAYFESSDGLIVTSLTNTGLAEECSVSSTPHYQQMMQHEISSFFFSETFDVPNSHQLPQTLMYCSRFLDSPSSGILTLFFDVSKPARQLLSHVDTEINSFIISTRSRQALFLSDNPENVFTGMEFTHTSEHRWSHNGFYCTAVDYNTGLYITTFTSWRLLLQSLVPTLLVHISVSILTLLFIILSLQNIAKSHLAPIVPLNSAALEYRPGKKLHVTIHSGNELEVLANNFNRMTDNINHQIEVIKSVEQENALTRYKILAMQEDPHYIYNTLSCISSLIRQNQTSQALAMNLALGRILRNRLSIDQSVFTTVEDELDILKQYLLIMDYRFSGKVVTSFDVEDTVQKKRIPKNLLQPLVENSFLHGFLPQENVINGQIDIYCYLEQQNLILEVCDNGCGIPEPLLDDLNKEIPDPSVSDEHIGLNNIRQKLHYLYHGLATFRINSDSFGTEVEISIPPDHDA